MGRLVKPMVFRNEDPLTEEFADGQEPHCGGRKRFGKERDRLSGLIDKFAAGGAAGCTSNPHSFFGKLTPEVVGDLNVQTSRPSFAVVWRVTQGSKHDFSLLVSVCLNTSTWKDEKTW